MSNLEEEADVTLEELKSIVIKFQQEEAEKNHRSQIIENDLGHVKREKIGKINPKYCVKWHHLEKEFKINRVIEYSRRHSREKYFPSTTEKKLRRLLVTKLVSDQLMIDYDTARGQINQIINLSYNDMDGFKVGSYTDHPKMEFISKVSKISKCTTKNDNMLVTTEDYVVPLSQGTTTTTAKITLKPTKPKITLKKPKITLKLLKK